MKYILLFTLTSEGQKTLKEKAERIKEINKEIEAFGVKVLRQYAVLGHYDFVNIVEAPDNDIISKMSVELGGRSTIKILTMPAITVGQTHPRAEIYSKEFKEGVILSYEYARHLIESAEILRDQGKHSPAKFLALHATEELGKAAMLLDEITREKPWITEERWNDKYYSHKHKFRRVNLAIQKNVVERVEDEITISWEDSKPTKKVISEGELMKRYAEDDLEKKYRSLYVDHGLVGGLRRWTSPLTLVGFDADSNIEIDFAIGCCKAIKKEAEKQGITLELA